MPTYDRLYPFSATMRNNASVGGAQTLQIPILQVTTGAAGANRFGQFGESGQVPMGGVDPYLNVAGTPFWGRLQSAEVLMLVDVATNPTATMRLGVMIGQRGVPPFAAAIGQQCLAIYARPDNNTWELYCEKGDGTVGGTLVLTAANGPMDVEAVSGARVYHRLRIDYDPVGLVRAYIDGTLAGIQNDPAFMPDAATGFPIQMAALFCASGTNAAAVARACFHRLEASTTL